VPISDRDYMKPSSRPVRRSRGPGGYEWFTQNPVLVIIVINIMFFLATSIASGLIVTLGLAPSLFLHRPWTIITSLFVHEGFGHIFGNMLTLFFFGRVLYQIVGQNKFLAVYFIGGILGNVAFMLFNMSSMSLVIGASGAVYAVAGALVVLMPNMRVMMWFIAPMPLWVVVLIFFVLWSFIPGVAWQAHMGGLATGLVAGYIFRKSGRYNSYR
jgi:membrane associated rhomboid family serine protease